MTPEVSRSPLVGVVMGSKSDWETMRHAAEVLTELGIPFESKVVSAHRTPERLFRYGREAEGRGLEVLIAGAGGAAHLPGMLAAISILPVLGVPVESKLLKGVDSLLSIVQMPRGVPVGTLAIGSSGAANAGLLAAAILARKYPADPRGPGALPPGSDRRRGRVAGMSPSPGASASPAVDQTEHGRARPVLYPPASLGVIGSGQLGRMFIQAAQRMGYRAGVLSTTEDTPAAQVAHWTVIGPADHLAGPARLRRRGRGGDRRVRERLGPGPAVAGPAAPRPAGLADGLDQPEPAAREELPGQQRHPARPLAAGPDRGRARRGGAGPRSAVDPQDRRSGYDGKGQVLVTQAAEAAAAWASLGRVACVAEGWVEFAAEVSVVVARGQDGNAVAYPVGLNRHERHILDTTMMPAPVGPIVAQEARTLALAVAQALGTVGVLCVEFFLTADGRRWSTRSPPGRTTRGT